MLFFRGLGILAIIAPIVLVIIIQLLFGDEAYLSGIGYICGGVLIYLYGNKLNREYRIKYSESKNILAKLDADHSLFFVRMEYWGKATLLLGIATLFPSTSVVLNFILQVFLLLVIVASAIAGILYLKNKYLGQSDKNEKQIIDKNTTEPKLTRREKLIGNTPTTVHETHTSSKSEAVRNLKELRNQPLNKIDSDHSQYMPK